MDCRFRRFISSPFTILSLFSVQKEAQAVKVAQGKLKARKGKEKQKKAADDADVSMLSDDASDDTNSEEEQGDNARSEGEDDDNPRSEEEEEDDHDVDMQEEHSPHGQRDEQPEQAQEPPGSGRLSRSPFPSRSQSIPLVSAPHHIQTRSKSVDKSTTSTVCN